MQKMPTNGQALFQDNNGDNGRDFNPKPKDGWDKLAIFLNPIGGLLTAVAIAGIGIYTNINLNRHQERQTNLRLYTELMSEREKAENSLRKDMFSEIFKSFLSPGADQPGAEPLPPEKLIEFQRLRLELIARNFHEILDIKPLFLHVLMGILHERSDSSDKLVQRQLQGEMGRLFDIADNIRGKQLETIGERGTTQRIKIPFKAVCTDKNVRTLKKGDQCVDPLSPHQSQAFSAVYDLKLPATKAGGKENVIGRRFEITVRHIYPRWNMARVSVNVLGGGNYSKDGTETFWVGRFDFPLVDNTYLSSEERYSLIIDQVDDLNEENGALYLAVWVIILFDLPTDTDRARKQYVDFRKRLLNGGFEMMQYSVYARHCASYENAQVQANRVKANLPPDGEVRIMKLTDKQYGKMEVFYGKKSKPTERPPTQLTLF